MQSILSPRNFAAVSFVRANFTASIRRSCSTGGPPATLPRCAQINCSCNCKLIHPAASQYLIARLAFARGNPSYALRPHRILNALIALAAHTHCSSSSPSSCASVRHIAHFSCSASVVCVELLHSTVVSLSLFATVQVQPSRTALPFSAPQTTLQHFCTSQHFEARSSSRRAAHSFATAFRSSTKSSKLRVAPKRFHGAIRRCGSLCIRASHFQHALTASAACTNCARSCFQSCTALFKQSPTYLAASQHLSGEILHSAVVLSVLAAAHRYRSAFRASSLAPQPARTSQHPEARAP
jgi:hypothetical protein